MVEVEGGDGAACWRPGSACSHVQQFLISCVLFQLNVVGVEIDYEKCLQDAMKLAFLALYCKMLSTLQLSV